MIRHISDDSSIVQIRQLLDQITHSLASHYKHRLQGAFLFGSYARNDQNPESDVDLLIVLDDITKYGQEVDDTSQVIGEASLQHSVSINAVFIREADWRFGDTPFLKNVREEAVAL